MGPLVVDALLKVGMWQRKTGYTRIPAYTLPIFVERGEYTQAKITGGWYTAYTRIYPPIHPCLCICLHLLWQLSESFSSTCNKSVFNSFMSEKLLSYSRGCSHFPAQSAWPTAAERKQLVTWKMLWMTMMMNEWMKRGTVADGSTQAAWSDECWHALWAQSPTFIEVWDVLEVWLQVAECTIHQHCQPELNLFCDLKPL